MRSIKRMRRGPCIIILCAGKWRNQGCTAQSVQWPFKMFISLAADIAAMRLTITGTRTRCEKDGAEADLRPSKHLLLHVCMETGMSDESGYTSATPPPSVPRLECLLLSSPSAALALVARPSGCVADMSSVRERRRYPHSAGDDAPEAGPGADSRLDLLTALPPEVAVNILRFLRGKDLCWYVLLFPCMQSI